MKIVTLDFGSLPNRFYRLAVVNTLSNIMVPLASLVDLAFLGHLPNINYLAGTSLAAVLFNYIYALLNFLRMGTTGMTAQAVGKNDQEEIMLLVLRNGMIALVLGMSLLTLQSPVREIGFLILDSPPEVKLAGIDYFNGRIWGAPAVLLNLVLIGWLLGKEKSGKVFIMSLLGSGTNVVLDYIFILYWKWNSFGAGLASALSQYITLLLGLGFLVGEVDWQKLPGIIPKIKKISTLKSAFVLNSNIFLRTLAAASTFALFNEISAKFGTVILAENTLLLQIFLFTVFVYEGIGLATESLSGYFKGKGDRKSLPSILKIAVGTSLVVGLLFSSSCNLFPETLFGLLTNHTEIIEVLKVYNPWLFAVMIGASIAFMLDGYFIGIAEVQIVRNVAVAATLLVFIPIASYAWYSANNHILWLALSLFIFSRSIMFLTQVSKTFVIESFPSS